MEYPPPNFLIVVAWLAGSISTNEMAEMIEQRAKMPMPEPFREE